MGLHSFDPKKFVDEASDCEDEPDIYVLPELRKLRRLQLSEQNKKTTECQAKVEKVISTVRAATGIHLINPDNSNPIDVGTAFQGNLFVEVVLGNNPAGAVLSMKGSHGCTILLKEVPHQTDCACAEPTGPEYALQVQHTNGKVTDVPRDVVTLHQACPYVFRFRCWSDGCRIYVNDVIAARCGCCHVGQKEGLLLVASGELDVKSVHIPATSLPSPFSMVTGGPLAVGDRINVFGSLNGTPEQTKCLMTVGDIVVPCPDNMVPERRVRLTVQRYKDRVCVYKCAKEIFTAEEFPADVFAEKFELSSIFAPSAVWIVSAAIIS
ncbi:unnamed protein product [Ixodes hexagonus]